MPQSSERVHFSYRLHRILNWMCSPQGDCTLRILRITSRVTVSTTALLILLLQFADPAGQRVPPWVEAAFDNVYQRRFGIIAVLVLVDAGCRIVIFSIQASGTNSRKLQRVLDTLAGRVFADENQDPENHHYRATLFKVRSFWFAGSWLGIVARSGHLYPQRQTVFCISAKTRRHCTEIAGECWRRGGVTIVKKLPDCRGGDGTETTIAEYRKEGYLDPREYDALNLRSCVFIATGIRIAGRLQFVLVLDSTDESTFPKQRSRHDGVLKLAAVAIEQVLE